MMEKCIIDLVAALVNVDDTYINVIGFRQNNETYQQAAEASFTAELYYQFKSIINNDKTGYYNNLQLHYDLTKERFNGQRPDLVLHRGPNSREDQRLYVEVKTDRSLRNYNADFDKIFKALDENNNGDQLGYSNALFISLHSQDVNAEEAINQYINNNNLVSDSRLKKVYWVHFTDNMKVNVRVFNELL